MTQMTLAEARKYWFDMAKYGSYDQFVQAYRQVVRIRDAEKRNPNQTQSEKYFCPGSGPASGKAKALTDYVDEQFEYSMNRDLPTTTEAPWTTKHTRSNSG